MALGRLQTCDVAQRGGQRCLFSLVNCLLELLHPEITPLDCAFTKYEVENALSSPLNHGVAQSRPPVHCQWNTFRLNYIVILVLAALPSALGVTAPPRLLLLLLRRVHFS